MKITEDILTAVSRASDHYGNVSQLAKAMGIAHSTILFWLSGKTTNISGQLWTTKIKPVLQPFLPYSQVSLSLHEPPGLYSTGAFPHTPPPIPVCHEAPVISLSELNTLDPTLESMSHFLKNNSDRVYAFAKEVKNGSFCFSAADLDDAGFPAGAYLLASSQHPGNGDVVLARLRESGEIVVRKYERDGDTAVLLPLDGGEDGKYSWNCREHQGFLLWIYPLIEMNMDLSPQV